jgi:CRISPR-associated endonuclease Csn1
MKKDNYSAYVGSVNSGKESARRTEKTTATDFYKNLEKRVKKLPVDEDTSYILDEISKETFLPKQLTPSNGVIPNQVHKKELIKILKNAEKHYVFLSRKDETGLSVSEKIVQLFEFQIPYYIGPFDNADGKGNGWAVRKENGPVMPWNIEEKIDTKQSAEKFIEKMVNHCTYLNGETVLPKNSLLYEKFMVLNELNNLKINGESISVDLKQQIYTQLFQKGKKVTAKKLINFLKIHNYVDQEDVEVSGIDGDFVNTLSNHKKFCEVFQVDCLSQSQLEMAEKIIFWSTIYGDSKKFLQEKILEEYGEVLDAAQIKRITGYKFKDWGRLSKQFLQLEGADTDTGEVQTIISRMWNENYNLMELLSNHFTYLDEIENKSAKIEKTLQDIMYEDLDELYISAPVKRMVWQTILILKEIYQVMGCAPERIFVEMARDQDAPKKRTISRKNKFAELYKKCKEDGRDWLKEIKNMDESRFRSKKLYLYYTQKGRCMYTGEPIDLEDLFNDNLYDIDHIYPRHFTKDDSIENNLVLVKKEKNAHKSDSFPIENSIRMKQHGWWKTLQDGGFITKEKYKRLVRNTEFTNEELANFVSRQIVETRQGTKVITQLFEKTFPESDIVYAKAGNVSAFRQKFDLLKCRIVNDFHHANDAYLNIVVGNTYFVKFTKNPYQFINGYRKDPSKYRFHMYKIFDYLVRNRNEIAWQTENDQSIRIVKKMMRKNTPLITRMNYEEHGGIADQTIYSAADAKKAKGVGYLPIKASDNKLANTEKYGGYKKFTGTYFFLVEHTVKKKRIRTLEAMPLYKVENLDTIEKLENYCRQELKLDDPSIRMKKIKMYSLIKVNGFYLYLTGRSGVKLLVSNAVAMILSYDFVKYVKKISQIQERDHSLEEIEEMEEVCSKKNLELYDQLVYKHGKAIYAKRPNPIGDKLLNWRGKFISLNIKDQIKVLLQILQLSMLSNMGADLTAIGGAKKIGVATLNKKISDKDEFKLINQSVTGLYESEIDLLKV